MEGCPRCGSRQIVRQVDGTYTCAKCGACFDDYPDDLMEPEDSDELEGEYDYDPETGLDWSALEREERKAKQ